ncbi:MAG TPA: carboxylating nicotinate-nucleotide diphosphorylase [Gemmatimonadales bacterium]|nr:carboxylating nicotinate-nucleotide diphosphorylase [Gemmatimonadales bacterium]
MIDFAADAERVAAIALAEDGARDVTSDVTVAPGAPGTGVLECRSGGVLAGTLYARAVAKACGCIIHWRAAEGDKLPRGAELGTVEGALAAILRAERPLLNFLQRATGIATATRAFVDAVHGTSARILHTRKTAPVLRGLDVAAVIAGGGCLHRLNLSDTVMVKDNHWRALAARGLSLGEALDAARARGVTSLQVEVESEAQLETACAAGATRLLIDNQQPATVGRWAERARRLAPGIEIEATGGITLANVADYARAGADYISVGGLTHSVRAADIALAVSGAD